MRGGAGSFQPPRWATSSRPAAMSEGRACLVVQFFVVVDIVGDAVADGRV